MLVLSRRAGETIVVNDGRPDEVRVTVVEVRGNTVRLGFEAADHVHIVREEVTETDQKEGAQ